MFYFKILEKNFDSLDHLQNGILTYAFEKNILEKRFAYLQKKVQNYILCIDLGSHIFKLQIYT